MRSVCTNKAGASKPLRAPDTFRARLQVFVYPVPAKRVLPGKPGPFWTCSE
ncbi:MAG: hypothetical protein WCB90_14905 [Methanosarcina sp.]